MESFHKNEFHTYRIKNVPRHILYFLSIFFFLTDSANNRFCLVLNMLACKLCSQLFIMSGNRINNCLMLIQQLWVAFFLLQIFNSVSVHLFAQIIQKLDQSAVVCCSIDNIMKCNVCLCDLCNIITVENRLKRLRCCKIGRASCRERVSSPV